MTFRFLRAALLTLLLLVACRRCEGGTHQQGAFQAVGPEHRQSKSHDVIGGQARSRPRDWKADRFPYVCSIRQRGKRGYLCSGFLIEPKWVVTAASCVDPTVTPFGLHPIVYCGAYTKATFDRKRLFSSRGVIHPDWTGDYRKGFDIALLRLNQKTNLSFPDINTDTSAIPSGTSLTALGWTRKTSGVLQISTDLPYIDREACQKSVSFEVQDHVICVEIKANDTLKGDAGGPLLLPDEGESIVDGFADLDLVLGVASGHNTYPANSTAVYTNIGHFWDWIEHVVHGKPPVHRTAVETKGSCLESEPPRKHQPDAPHEEKRIPVEKTPATLSATPKTKPPEKHRTHLPSVVEKTVPKQIPSPSVPPPPSKPKVPPKKMPSPKPVAPTKTKPLGTRYAGLSGKDLRSLLKTVIGKMQGDHASAVREYLREGLSPDSFYMSPWDSISYGSKCYSLLHWATYYHSPDCAEVLIEFGANVNPRDGDGRTPLFITAHYGHLSVAKVLLTHGADIDARDKYQNTALIRACYYFEWNVAEFLIDKGANVQAIDNVERTALHYASKHGGAHVVKLLLSKDAEVDARDKDGKTPLWLASCHPGFSNVQTMKALLDGGASKTAKAKDGTRPYDVVCNRSPYCTYAYKKQLRDLLDPSRSSVNEQTSVVDAMNR